MDAGPDPPNPQVLHCRCFITLEFMALYSLSPLTAQQIRHRWRRFFLGLFTFIVLLFAAVPLWLKLHGEPVVPGVFLSLIMLSAIVAIMGGVTLLYSVEAHAGPDRHTFEISPGGFRFSGADGAGGPLDTQFLPRAHIRHFESAPDGRILIRGRWSHGAIAVPQSLDGGDRLRQELLDLGVPEIRRKSLGWSLHRCADWSLGIPVACAILYMFEGSIPWLVLACTLVSCSYTFWNSWVARRLREGRWRRSEFLAVLLAVFFLYFGTTHAWHLAHPAHHGDSTITSLREQPPQGA